MGSSLFFYLGDAPARLMGAMVMALRFEKSVWWWKRSHGVEEAMHQQKKN